VQSPNGYLTPDSAFTALVTHWLDDIDAEGRNSKSTRNLYERNMRTLVLPVFSNNAAVLSAQRHGARRPTPGDPIEYHPESTVTDQSNCVQLFGGEAGRGYERLIHSVVARQRNPFLNGVGACTAMARLRQASMPGGQHEAIKPRGQMRSRSVRHCARSHGPGPQLWPDAGS